MQYYVIVNENEQIPIFSWSPVDFNAVEELKLATDDLVYVKTVFKNIDNLKIVTDQGDVVAEYTQYDTFQNISYNGVLWSADLNGFNDQLTVKLQKTNLTEEVDRINKKVNNIVDVDSMTTEEYREYLLQTFSDKGQQVIFDGTNVTLTDGSTKLFTYNLEDQSNLLNALFTIQALGDLTIVLPYHSHAEPCSLFSARDILLVYFTLQFYSTRVQTRVNILCNWVRNIQTKEELEQITFESDLPQEYMDKVNEVMGPTYELAEALMRKYFPDGEEVEDIEDVDIDVESAGAIENSDDSGQNEEENGNETIIE